MPRRKPVQAEEYIDPFNWKTVIGAFFVGMVMMPASIYISMFSGGDVGGAATWVTIILFAEVARRAIQTLKKQEMYLLYHVAGSMAGGGMFGGLIWNQYLRQSPQAMAFGVAQGMPTWAAPLADSPAILTRALWHPDWYPAIGLMLLGSILWRLNFFGLGYALFRVTSDLERLPFPMSSIAAGGATALAESPDKQESWRWRCFSLGSMLGLGFGIIYIGIPAVTGLLFTAPIYLFPIPWIDFTTKSENVLPTALLNLSFDLGGIIWGMVVPFWAVIGSFGAMLVTSVFGNPVLQSLGMFPTWRKGMSILPTQFATSFDFWMSIGIGTALAVATVGIIQLVRALRAKSAEGKGKAAGATELDILMGKEGAKMFVGTSGDSTGSMAPPKGRGDWPVWFAVAMFLVSTSGYVYLCHYLVPRFPVSIMIFFGFVWTPLTSYISARMTGLTGGGVGFPYVREASFILSGYRGVDIWFAPIPLQDMGWSAAFFKQFALTRTKFTAIIKAELLMLPISTIFSFVFWAFIWHITAIPAYNFPFIDKMWPFNAINGCLFMTATMEGRQWLLEALKFKWMAAGYGGGLALYAGIVALKWPVFIFYGAIGGINAMPGGMIFTLIGALLGRFYFVKRFGPAQFFQYIPVVGAGFAAGFGLVGMLAIGITMVMGSVVTKPF